MITIYIFLASSIVEFEWERKELSAFVGRLNRAYVPREVYVELTVCEDLSNAMARGRKQDEYNALIRASRHFILLVGKEIGDYSLEEFNTALEAYRATGFPRLHLFRRESLEKAEVTQSVHEFFARLEAEQLPYICFTSIETVMVALAEALCQDPLIGGDFIKCDGYLEVDGKKVFTIRPTKTN